jgi:hypothetical protein
MGLCSIDESTDLMNPTNKEMTLIMTVLGVAVLLHYHFSRMEVVTRESRSVVWFLVVQEALGVYWDFSSNKLWHGISAHFGQVVYNYSVSSMETHNVAFTAVLWNW